MKYRRLTDTGDYSFGRSQGDFISDAEAVSQAILTKLKFLKGEWWENTGAGLPLFQSIIGQSGTQENIKSIDMIITSEIMSVPGVIKITDYNGTYENRQYAISLKVDTIYGEASVEVVL